MFLSFEICGLYAEIVYLRRRGIASVCIVHKNEWSAHAQITVVPVEFLLVPPLACLNESQ